MQPLAAGTYVEIGDARGYQAICLYRSGRIIVSPTYTSPITAIMEHEVWHVVDWRDNYRIDWGESVPPSSTSVSAAGVLIQGTTTDPYIGD